MKDILLSMLEELGNDVIYTDFTDVDDYIAVDFNDFIGFDSEGDEIYRNYNNPEKVAEFQEFLEYNALNEEKGFYTIYHFNDVNVHVSFTSYDI